MKSIIIYSSLHGSTKRYAERLAEITGMDVIEYKDAIDLAKYDRIIYFGAIYASGVTGLKKIVGNMTPDQKLFVVTVGMADPEDKVYIETIRKALKEQIPPQLYDEDRIFHLRGAIDYNELDFKHRMVMSMIHSKVSKMPEEELSTVFKVILDTYGKKVDYVNHDSLKPLQIKLLEYKKS